MNEPEVKKLVNSAIEKHCEYDDMKHAEILERIEDNHAQAKKFFESATPVIEAFNTARTSGGFVYGVLILLAKMAVAIGVIIGVMVGIKEWIRK